MPKENDDLGLMYLCEQTTPDDMKISNLQVTDKGHIFFVQFDSGLHSFDVINRNERCYVKNNIEECINTDDKIQDLLKNNAWYGEQDHPLQITLNDKLNPKRLSTIFMPNRSHKILRPRFEGNMLYATIQTASGTAAGEGFAKEIIQGLVPCFSCRALATLKMINNKPTVIVRKLVTYDWVLYPSHKEATIVGAAKGVIKGIKTMTESAKDFVGKKSHAALIPLKEILEYCGTKDVNTQVIMESFDLDMDSLYGIDKSGKFALIHDENNTIYSRLDPRTVKEVHDFYSSFNL